MRGVCFVMCVCIGVCAHAHACIPLCMCMCVLHCGGDNRHCRCPHPYLLEHLCHFCAHQFQAVFTPSSQHCVSLLEDSSLAVGAHIACVHAQGAELSGNLIPQRQPCDQQLWGYKYTSPLRLIKITLMCTLTCLQKSPVGWSQSSSPW